MFGKMLTKNYQVLEREIAATFSRRFTKFGPQPEASLWFSEARQCARFSIIADIICERIQNRKVSICDIGCGYGGFLKFLQNEHNNIDFEYTGYDLADNLIEFCDRKLSSKNARFMQGSRPIELMDFSIMSGTYNYAPQTTVTDWRSYFRSELESIFAKTKKCLILNLMIADLPRISKSGIFYEELNDFKVFCEKRLGAVTTYDHVLLKNEKTFCITR
jgi:SAM-dependent methyltransferase